GVGYDPSRSARAQRRLLEWTRHLEDYLSRRGVDKNRAGPGSVAQAARRVQPAQRLRDVEPKARVARRLSGSHGDHSSWRDLDEAESRSHRNAGPPGPERIGRAHV